MHPNYIMNESKDMIINLNHPNQYINITKSGRFYDILLIVASEEKNGGNQTIHRLGSYVSSSNAKDALMRIAIDLGVSVTLSETEVMMQRDLDE